MKEPLAEIVIDRDEVRSGIDSTPSFGD